MRKSFTLIEIIVVIGIIALLSGLGASSYSGFQQAARDTRRKSDLETITNALNAYYAVNGRFPEANSSVDTGTDCLYGSYCHVKSSVGKQWIPSLVTGSYIEELPLDPLNTPASPTATEGPWITNIYLYTYGNVSADGQQYDLTARLENVSDPDRSQIKNYKYGFDGVFTWNTYTNGGQVYESSPKSQ